jgi:hypothetical protein
MVCPIVGVGTSYTNPNTMEEKEIRRFNVGDKIKVPQTKTSGASDYIIFLNEYNKKYSKQDHLFIVGYDNYQGAYSVGSEPGVRLFAHLFSESDLELYQEQDNNKSIHNYDLI